MSVKRTARQPTITSQLCYKRLVADADSYDLLPTAPSDHADLHAAFATIVAKDEGYPQFPGAPLMWEDFEAYWLRSATVGCVARANADGARAGACPRRLFNNTAAWNEKTNASANTS